MYLLLIGTFLRKVPKDDCPIGSASDVRIQLVKNNWDSKLNNLRSEQPTNQRLKLLVKEKIVEMHFF